MCQRCRKHNLKCTGPVQGPIIINQTSNVTSRYGKTKPSTKSRAVALLGQPSHKAIISRAFLSEFITSVTSIADTPTKPAWLTQLDDIPRDQRDPVLDLALQATATAYCAVQERNFPVIQDACRMYGEALSEHSKSIFRLSEGPTTAVICTSVVLSLFEAIWPTAYDTYCIHLTAARGMLAVLVPRLSQSDVSHTRLLRQVYTHVLYQSVRSQLVTI